MLNRNGSSRCRHRMRWSKAKYRKRYSKRQWAGLGSKKDSRRELLINTMGIGSSIIQVRTLIRSSMKCLKRIGLRGVNSVV